MATVIEILEPDPHPGQRRIMEDAGSRNLVRCGRQFGKSEMIILLARETALPWDGSDPAPVGVCSANYQLFDDLWQRMTRRLRPVILRKSKSDKRIELIGGGVIEGWSLEVEDPGRGRRYKRLLIDEAGLVPNLGYLWRTALEPTLLSYNGDAWLFGTPKPISRDFNLLFRLGEKRIDGWRAFRGRSLDNTHLPKEALSKIEAARHNMPDWEWRQEYEGEPTESTTGFFRESVIQAQREAYVCDPLARGSLVVPLRYVAQRDAILTHGKLERIEWHPDSKGAWRLWFDVRKGMPSARTTRGCLGVDIGCGVGSSNSVIAAGDSDTGEKWAEYASAGDSPEELARIAAAFGWWIGGRDHPARINFDATGATGEQFIKVLRQLEYPNIHCGYISAVKVKRKSDDEYGFTLNPKSKHALFSEYRSALATDALMNPSGKALDECLEYHVDELNRVVHESEFSGEGDDETGARIPHGDRVVADALLHQVMASNPLSEERKGSAPKGSLAYWEELEMQAAAEAEESERG